MRAAEVGPPPQKAEACLGQYCVSHGQGNLYDQGGRDIGQDVDENDPVILDAPQRTGCLYIIEVGDGHNLPSHQPRKLRDIDDPDGDDGVDQLGTEDGRNRQGQDQGWKRENCIHEPHEHAVDPSSPIPCDETDQQAGPQ